MAEKVDCTMVERAGQGRGETVVEEWRRLARQKALIRRMRAFLVSGRD